MKTKTITTLITLCLLSLTLNACGSFMRGYGQEAGANGKSKGFKNARGGNVWTCRKNIIHAHEGNSYLEKYGLPLEIGGNFICDGDIPKLPKDCQGREIRSEAEFVAFWEQHQLPIGLKYFECINGKPRIPDIQLATWKQMEEEQPTCKDSRGRKRRCV